MEIESIKRKLKEQNNIIIKARSSYSWNAKQMVKSGFCKCLAFHLLELSQKVNAFPHFIKTSKQTTDQQSTRPQNELSSFRKKQNQNYTHTTTNHQDWYSVLVLLISSYYASSSNTMWTEAISTTVLKYFSICWEYLACWGRMGKKKRLLHILSWLRVHV